jgi:hypothetical protein
MGSNVVTQREELHWIIDGLPEEKLAVAHDLLGTIVQPFSEHLAGLPYDDEGELSDETIAGIERARAEFARGESISHEEILREFGL